MRSRLLLCVIILIVAGGLLSGYDHPSANQTSTPQSSREEAYRANNIGVAFLEQFNYKEAAAQFRQALKLDPSLALARVNLVIALYNMPDLDGALRELKAAADVLPASPQAHYVLGLIARSQNRAADGIAEFQRTLQIDPRDPGANINLGQLHMQQRQYPEAIAAFRAALANEPYNVTATYNLAMALTRSGERQEGQAMMQKFQVLRTKGYATTIGQNYLEQGRYAEAIASTGTEQSLVDTTKPDVLFTDATATVLTKAVEPRAANRSPIGQSYRAGEINEQVKRQIIGTLAGGDVPLDFDGDGDMDLLDIGGRGLALYRNDGGKLADVTSQSGIPSSATVVITGLAGDYDNDLRPDIVLLSYGGLKLYHNDGNGKFSDRTAGSDIPAYPYFALSAALADVDHDGDLDIFIAGFVDLMKPLAGDPSRSLVFPNDFPPAPNLLVRNKGEGKFTDITAAALVAGTGGHAIAVVPTDFDNHRDIDLLVANYGAAPTLFSNQRDGTFRDVAGEVGLNIKGGVTSVAAGDLNKDDFTDFFFGKADGPGEFAISDGKSHFVRSSAPGGSEGSIAAQFLDYDNDGLLDLVLLQNQGARVLRNLGT